MELHPDPTAEPKFSHLSRYNAKSCEDITAFIDVDRSMKSRNFEENSILNAKSAPKSNKNLHSISENISVMNNDSGVGLRCRPNFVTSTPLTYRKSCTIGDTVSVNSFDKCTSYSNSSGLRKGSSEPDILDMNSSRESIQTTKSTDTRKRWKLLKPPFRKGALDCLLLWRGKKPKTKESSSSRWVLIYFSI
jgi:hypothetical protein